MRLLLTNDDGYLAPGLQALYNALSPAHEVIVVAPDSQRSAVGHAVSFLTTFDLRATPQGYSMSGTPADCVKIGLLKLVPNVDLVVSGINAGANIGTDTHYSGTVSAAMEAVFQGVPAVAFSSLRNTIRDPAYLGALSLRVVNALLEHPLPAGTMLNVNYPDLVLGDKVRFVVTPMGFQRYDEDIQTRGENEYFYSGYYKIHLPGGDNDCDHVLAGDVAITPLTWDMTAHHAMNHAKSILDCMKEC